MLKYAIITAGIIQGISFCIVSFKHKNRSFPNRIFAALMILITLDLAGAYFDISDTAREFPRLYNFNTSFPFLYSPFVFLYIKAVSGKMKSFRLRDILHAFPFLTHLAIYSPIFGSSEDLRNMVPGTIGIENATINILPDYPALILQTALYHYLMLRHIAMYRKNHTRTTPGAEKRLLPWMILVFSVSLFSYITFFAFMFSGSIQQYVYEILFTVVIYFSAYKLLSMPEIFSGNTLKNNYPTTGTTNRSETQDQLIERFTVYIETSKIYLEPDITIGEICERIGTPVHRISRALNRRTRKNFYCILNEYRVEEAKRKLRDTDLSDRSVLAIGLDSGFNSKSSFNDVFKKITGVTPTEFRSNAREQIVSE